MVSLIRLLVALPPARLTRLAQLWGLLAPTGDSLVSRLYREMTDDWAVRRVIDQLDEAERALLYRLADQRDGCATGGELLRTLPFTRETLEALLRGLREWGLVAVSSLDAAAYRTESWARSSPGRAPVAGRGDWDSRWASAVPADLVRAIRRARDEVADDGRGQESLRRMLGALDLPAIQQLALRWKVPGAERSFRRELIRGLEARLCRREAVTRALSSVDERARQLFAAIGEAGGRLSLAAARARLGLADPDLRRAFDVLHSLYLVHETYVSGDRTLFIPVGVARDQRPAAPVEVPDLVEVGAPPALVPTDDSLPADLDALLARARVRPFRRHFHLPPGGRALPTRPPAGPGSADDFSAEALSPRAHYLLHASLSLGLLEGNDEALVPSPAVDEWATLDQAAKREAMFRALLVEEHWREHRPADPRRAYSPLLLRGYVAEALDPAEPDRWYSISSAIKRVRALIAAREQRGPEPDPATLPDSREVAAVLGMALSWIGVLVLGCNEDGKPIAFQVTALGRRLLDSRRAAAPRPS